MARLDRLKNETSSFADRGLVERRVDWRSWPGVGLEGNIHAPSSDAA